MTGLKTIIRVIYFIAGLLILEPFIKIVLFMIQSHLPFETIWSNVVENGHNFPRFFIFWVVSPLAGVFLLTFSNLAYVFYLFLTFFRLYSLFNFRPYSWPYFTENPHASTVLFESFNFILMCFLFYPIVQRLFLSKHLRHIWDARGRMESEFEGYMFLEGQYAPIEVIFQNISSGGAKVKLAWGERPAPADGKVVFFDHENHPIHFEFRVAYQREEGGGIVWGIEFCHLSPKEKLYLRTCFHENSLEYQHRITVNP